MKGRQSTRSVPTGLRCSMARPNRIIAALAPKMAMSAERSATPVIIAMSTIISEALTEYSHHRNGLVPRSRLRMYRALVPGSAQIR